MTTEEQAAGSRVSGPAWPAEGLEELVLELSAPRMETVDGLQRASAQARLLRSAADGGGAAQASAPWRLVVPEGVDAESLDWYLRRFPVWPDPLARQRAEAVEAALQAWGRRLYQAAWPSPRLAEALPRGEEPPGGRPVGRFCVRLLDDGVAALQPHEAAGAREAAAQLLDQPWELLHDGHAWLFQGPHGGSVRRCLGDGDAQPQPPDPPGAGALRVLSVAARPPLPAGGLADHRAGALALGQAVESLDGALEMQVLVPPTWAALCAELERARQAGRPWQVLHLDAAWVEDPASGAQTLCLEAEGPSPLQPLAQSLPVAALGARLREHGIALVWLEAPAGSTPAGLGGPAAGLLQAGVPAVVAMRHGLPARSARALAETFFGALCHGDPVRAALRAGCAALQREAWAGAEAGQGPLDDWFVPALFLQRDGLRLCQGPAAPGRLQEWRAGMRERLGEVPDEPAVGFVGRGPELQALQRLLHAGRHAVVNGPAGAGKTALAAEFAAWMLRCGRMHRAAFATVAVHDSAADVLERLGRQLVPGFELSNFFDLTQARQEVERVLAQAPTLLVLDQMESLQPSALPGAALPAVLARAAEEEAGAILSLCRRLLRQPGTRLLLTSRAVLPTPFDDAGQRLELQGLDVESGLQLLARLLRKEAGAAVVDASHEGVEALVQAARGHAWLLGELPPHLLLWGPQATCTQVLHKLAVAQARYPAGGEAPMLAGLELCLERLPPVALERVPVLGMFHGGFHPEVLQSLMGWTAEQVEALVRPLCDAGLATRVSFGHVLLLPALVPALRSRLDEAERQVLLPLWGAALSEQAGVLLRQQREHPQRAAALTLLALPDWLAMLDAVERGAPPAEVVEVANLLIALLRPLRRPGLLAQLLLRRDAAQGRSRPPAASQAQSAPLSPPGPWDAARLGAERARIEGLLGGGRGAEALDAARGLLERVREAGAPAEAGVELARACLLGARAARTLQRTAEGLPLLEEACARLDAAPSDHRLAAACWAERAEGQRELGRLDEAAQAYRSFIQAAQAAGDLRQAAIGQGQLGNLCLQQERWAEALAALDAARRGFEQLGDARAVAAVCYQAGLVQLKAGRLAQADAAWREALERQTRLHDALGQALTLNQLGVLYDEHLGRAEDALGCFSQGAQCAGHAGNPAVLSLLRGNAADCLRRLGRLDAARSEAWAALKDALKVGSAAQPWARWALLGSIEQAAGDVGAAERARREAASAYLAWRRAGGEAGEGNGQLGAAVGQALRAGDRAQAEAVLQELAADPRLPAEDRVYVRMLQVIVSGSRDRTLADTPGLHYTAAAEVVLLLEELEGGVG